MQFSAQNNADKPTNSAVGKPMIELTGGLGG